MKTKLFLLILSISLSIHGKAQPSLITTCDSNFLIHDYVPDTILYGVTGLYNHGDFLSIDINDDGILDFKYYYVFTSGGLYRYIGNLNTNCSYSHFSTTDTISLVNPTIFWYSGALYWSYLDFKDRIFALRLQIGSDYYYGWIHAMAGYTDEVPTSRATITVDKYAFCKIPNYPLHLGQTEIVGIQENSTPDSTHMYLANSGNTLIVNSGKTIKNVTVFNATGSLVASQQNINASTANVSMAGLAHGTYLVQVVFGDMSSYARQVLK
jgi:hypothetical protein